MTQIEDKIKEIAEPSKIFLSIKADDNEKNQRIHDAFREMASVEFPGTHDNYTLTLGKLLEYYETDAKIEMIWEQLQLINQRLDDLEAKSKEIKKEPKRVAF